VLLAVRVARERVLLSDFHDWHTVLNQSLHVPPLPGESDPATWRTPPVLQATIRELRAEDVVRAVRIR